MVFAWFVGVALVGAGLGALIAHLVWTQVGTDDPPAVAVIVVSVVGAVVAMVLQRYVIIIGTAFGGAWTIIVGVTNAMAARAARGAGRRCLDSVSPDAGAADSAGSHCVDRVRPVRHVVQLGVTSRKR